MNKFVNKKQEGFTIIELLIASVIITAGLLAVVSMIVNAFTRTVPLTSKLTASYLTQEGFEVVRRIRDTNFNKRWSGDNDSDDYYWLEGLVPEESDSNKGSVYYDAEELGDKHEDNLHIHDGLYSYNSDGKETTFKRKIELERDCYQGYEDTNSFDDDYCGDDGAEYVLVTITINWEEKGEPKEYKAKTKLFNWY